MGHYIDEIPIILYRLFFEERLVNLKNALKLNHNCNPLRSKLYALYKISPAVHAMIKNRKIRFDYWRNRNNYCTLCN